MTKTLSIIVASTRTNRVGRSVAEWIGTQATAQGFDAVEFLDLKELALPPFDAPVPPMYQAVDTPEAKAWGEKISAATHLLFVTPEYNQSIPSSLKSAIDYLSSEWNGKPAGIVSYGYMGGGVHAAAHLHDIATFIKTDLVETAATIQFGDTTIVDNAFAADGVTEDEITAVQTELSELAAK